MRSLQFCYLETIRQRDDIDIGLLHNSPQSASQRNFVDSVLVQQCWQGRHCTTELIRLQIQEFERI